MRVNILKKLLVLCSAALILIQLTGCTNPQLVMYEGTAKYGSGHPEQALATLDPLLNEQSHQTYPLFQLNDAYVQLTLGNYIKSADLMQKGLKSLEVELGTMTTITDLFGSEGSMHYRGFQHEHVMACYYMGLSYFLAGDYSNAEKGFRQAIEQDIKKADNLTNTYCSVNFFLGETYLRLKEYDNATVAFTNCTKLNPKFDLAMYKLAYVLNKQGRKDEATDAYTKYKAMVAPESLLPIDGSGSYLFMVIDAGYGPYLKPDPITGGFSSYEPAMYFERTVSVTVNNKSNNSVISDNLYDRSKEEANAVGDITKKAASLAVKKAASMIPIIGAFVGNTDADLRKWNLLPGDIHVAYVPVEKGLYDVNLQLKNTEGENLVNFEQSYYYLPADVEGANKVIYVRSIFQKHNQNPAFLEIK
ncbi:MAG: tetratricopeptide repeat protein [Ignavibacteria bacterium]|nr:tetratricopeptide repeat protein [Ignavibacteria bacterium]